MCLHYIKGASASNFPSEKQNVQIRQLLGKNTNWASFLSEPSSEELRTEHTREYPLNKVMEKQQVKSWQYWSQKCLDIASNKARSLICTSLSKYCHAILLQPRTFYIIITIQEVVVKREGSLILYSVSKRINWDFHKPSSP